MTTRPIDNILSTADLKRTAEHLSAKMLTAEWMRRENASLGDQIKTSSPHSGWFVVSTAPAGTARQYHIMRYEVQEYIRAKDGRVCDRLIIEKIGDDHHDVKAAKRALKAV